MSEHLQAKQTIHPLATKTLGELADIANDVYASGQKLDRANFPSLSDFDWECVTVFYLTRSKQ